MVPGTQRREQLNFAAWAALLRGLAILSLLFLPTSFRAGAEATHSHALLQLLADAADGHVDHHRAAVKATDVAENWLDPRVEVRDEAGSDPAAANHVDPGSHEDSAPATASVHMVIALIPFSAPPPRKRASLLTSAQPLLGLQPAVLLPPPR